MIFAGLGANTQGEFTKIGANAGRNAYSVDFEREADYVGLYAMAMSGYSIDNAPNFWRRMGTKSPSSIDFKSTHPTSPERFVALETTIKEINKKRSQGGELRPEMKKDGGFFDGLLN